MNINELQNITRTETDQQTLNTYSRDASIFEVQPQAVTYPASIDELSRLITWVRKEKESGQTTSLSARNAGSCMSGGSLTEHIMVDMNAGFRWIGELDEKNKTLWVGAGTLYKDVEAALEGSGLMFAPYTSSKDFCGIGGMVGNNASGEKSIRYGATIDNINRLNMILQDGKEYEFGPLNAAELQAKLQLHSHEGAIYRAVVKLLEDNWKLIWQSRPNVRKNAAGYQLWKIWDRDKTIFNLAKLFVGSQGTLGFTTSVQLQLVEAPQYTRMLIVALDDVGRLADAVQCIMMHHPEGVETYDKHTYELAKEHMPAEALAAHQAAGKELVVIAQFAEKTKDETDHAEDVCQKALRRLGFEVRTVRSETEADAHWALRRASYGLLKDHAKGKRAVPFIEDTIVAVDHYGEYLQALLAILDDYDMTYTYAGHIGDGSIRLIPLVDMEQPGVDETVFELARRVYDLVFAFGGSMSVDHNDGLIRTPFLPRMYRPEMIELFVVIKNLFDPLDIFNPGKKVDGEVKYAKAHMIRTNQD